MTIISIGVGFFLNVSFATMLINLNMVNMIMPLKSMASVSPIPLNPIAVLINIVIAVASIKPTTHGRIPPRNAFTPAYFIIAALIRNFMKYEGVKAFLSGIRPCVVGLILATAITMFMSAAIGFRSMGDTLAIDFKGIFIFAILIAITIIAKLVFKKKPAPILMILISAGLGMLMYSI